MAGWVTRQKPNSFCQGADPPMVTVTDRSHGASFLIFIEHIF
jgi:hypothetical protein